MRSELGSIRLRCRLVPGWASGTRRQLLDARSREAVELARRLGDPSTLGWALTAGARIRKPILHGFLMARDAPGDRATAEGLLQQALAIYRDLEMASADRRLTADVRLRTP